jgi:hypothetical protein
MCGHKIMSARRALYDRRIALMQQRAVGCKNPPRDRTRIARRSDTESFKPRFDPVHEKSSGHFNVSGSVVHTDSHLAALARSLMFFLKSA